MFASGPWLSAILLIGGDKSGDWHGWYRSRAFRTGWIAGAALLGQGRPRVVETLCSYGTRLNAWAVVPLQVYCASWTPLPAEGAAMHRPELSAVKV